MKKILTISIVLTTMLSATNTDSITISKEYLNNLINNMNKLQKEVKLLNKKVNALTSNKVQNKITTKKDDLNQLKKDVKDLKLQVKDNTNYTEDVEDSVDKLTTKVLTNGKLGFTRLKFDTTMHNFKSTMADGSSSTNKNVDTVNLKVELEKKISPKLTFRGELSMFKYFSQGNYYPASNYDNLQGRAPSDSSLYVTRAYIDWKVSEGKIPTILTIGRQPSSSGPSWQYSNNGVRYGTYDALVFDGNTDGVVATMYLNHITSLKNPVLRLAYGKGFQNNGIYKSDDNGLADTNVYGLFFESAIPSVKNSFMQLYSSVAQNVASDNTTVGDIKWFGGMFEVNNVKNLDFFAHFSVSRTSPNGKLDSNNAGLLTSTNGDTDSKTGIAMWLGTRYNLAQAKIGFEYGHGSKNWINMTQGSDNILNPRSVRGSVYDLYGIYPIDKTIGVNAFIKAGMTIIDYDYSNSGNPLGAPVKISSSMSNASSVPSKLNDLYLNFQVNY